MSDKPKIAVHKFSSCDGCQLAILNLGEKLIELTEIVDIMHFAEAGPVNPHEKVDVAFVEGSITTPHELDRIQEVRSNSQYVVTIGACATSGGLQALRNFKHVDIKQWTQSVYAKPEFISTLETSTAIAKHIKVDLEIWGCPINSKQIIETIRALCFGVEPVVQKDSLCLECKRQGNACVMVTKQEPCLGPITQSGCGALCPSVGRGCYGCYGPDENPNTKALAKRFSGLGLLPNDIARKLHFINSQAKGYLEIGNELGNKTLKDDAK